jgi:hypothetical protein
MVGPDGTRGSLADFEGTSIETLVTCFKSDVNSLGEPQTGVVDVLCAELACVGQSCQCAGVELLVWLTNAIRSDQCDTCLTGYPRN